MRGTEPAPVRTGTVVRTSTAAYWMFGTLQLLSFLGASLLGVWVLVTGLTWSYSAPTSLQMFERSAIFGAGAFAVTCVLPILAKWLVIGRFRPREIRLWGLGHFRFWVVKSLIRANPLVALRGPVYNMYLRALGAKIGRGTTILSSTVPVATDLISIGAHTIIRRDSSFSGYRAVPGKIQFGRVQIGNDVFIGEKTALDIESSIGDGAQLGHTSSVHSGQYIPAGQRWHGVPAEPTAVDYRVIPAHRGGGLRRFVYGTLQLLSALVILPLLNAAVVAVAGLPAFAPTVQGVIGDGYDSVLAPAVYGWIAAITAALFVVATLTGLAAMIIVPRLLSVLVRPGRVYPLYGIRWIAAQMITRLGNSEFYMTMFGDSSVIVHYLRAIGYRMPQLEQTGSNFGTELKQDAALLTTIGSGTMVSDALSIMNADFSADSFRMSPVTIGSHCFIGNNIAYPADARLGENVLLGSKVMVPMDGPVRENVGLLGSPCFEIPRTVARDTEFDHLKEPGALRRLLRRKNRHNATSMLLFMAVRWFQTFIAVTSVFASADLYYLLGIYGVVGGIVATVVFNVLFAVLVERLVMGFRGLQARFVSIYDPYFWRHERLWKLGYTNALFNGTPFKNVVWRMLGVRIGRRVFDDGCSIPEKTLVTIGDDAVLNAGSLVQCHSLEDGSFKSDHTLIGAGATIGVDTFVHYGVTMGEGSTLEADAFLMKGETVAPFAIWRGNPATEVRIAATPVVPTPVAAAAVGRAQPAVAAATVPLGAMQAPPSRQTPTQQVPAQPASPVRPVPLAPVAPVRPATPLPPTRPAAGRPGLTMPGPQTPAPRFRPVAPHARPVGQGPASTPRAATALPEAQATRPEPTPSGRPHVDTRLPGPRSAELLAHRQAHQPTVQARRLPFAVAKAGGSHVWDVDGNMFIDFLAGAGTVSPEQRDVATHGPAMRRDDVLSNIAARGEQIAGRLAGLANHPAVREVRGAGLMWEIELNACRDGRSAAELADDVRSRALHGRLIVDLGGRDDCVVRMLPPLNVTAELVDIAMSILLHAIEGAYVRVLKAG